MAKVLLLGYSRIAQKRVIPALQQSVNCTGIEIASISKVPQPTTGKVQKIYKSYEQALEGFDGNLVYISLPNHMHDNYLKISSQLGYNCIVDKPAVLEIETIKFLELNQPKKNQVFAESVVFMEHPAWNELINEVGGPENIRGAVGSFTIPSLPRGDFRMQVDCDGGALLDMAAYAMGMGRWLWNEPPVLVTVAGVRIDFGLIMSFSILVDYGKGRSTAGAFGFGMEYRNQVCLYGPDGWGQLDRVFTLPANMKAVLEGKRKNIGWSRTIEPADSFGIFLDKVLTVTDEGLKGSWFSKMRDTFFDCQCLVDAVKKHTDQE